MTSNSSHPKGLYVLSLVSVGERFSYYGMRALLALFLISALYDKSMTAQIYGAFTGLVYLLPLLGGYIADRYWGNNRSIVFGGVLMAVGYFLLFGSAACVQQSIFAEGATIDASVNNLLSKFLLFSGLVFLCLGNGFFKPTTSSLVGELYDEGDSRRDAAYTLFYMGVNLGGFIAPILCGIYEGDWTNPNRFRWAFLIAGIIMVVSVVAYSLLRRKYVVSPMGFPLGNKPQHDSKHEDGESEGLKISAVGIVCLCLSIPLWLLFTYHATEITDYISGFVCMASIVVPAVIISDKGLTRTERMRIGVIYIIVAFSIAFWACFEQAGISLAYLAKDNVDCHVMNFSMPSSWFQAVNPICVILFAPIMAYLWKWLNQHDLEPSAFMKQAIGLILMGLGYVVIMIGTDGMDATTRISMFWLIALYALHSFGELALSPIGMSLVSKLSPARLGSLLMGVWFLSSASSNIFAGYLSALYPESGSGAKVFLGFYSIETIHDFFFIFIVIAGLAGLCLALLTPLLKKMTQ